MRKLLLNSWLVAVLCVLSLEVSAAGRNEKDISVIPYPKHIQVRQGVFEFTSRTVFVAGTEEVERIAGYFREQMKRSTGYPLPISNTAKENKVQEYDARQNSITLAIDTTLPLNEEGYRLDVTNHKIDVIGKSLRGLFYGMQTLMQLLPPAIQNSHKVEDTRWSLPCVSVEDEPRFAYRGMMLDVCRYFMDVDFIKKQLDLMAMFKMNYFHWHLTDDHLWTIEVKKYPLLTEIGSVRHNVDGSICRGFYTQEQIKEVVAYAAARQITVIPEIELPGHALAAITAYPELSCIDGPFQLRNQWGVEDNVYCAGNDRVFDFLEDVIDEVVPLFPGKYFHIGGDECPKVHWKRCRKCQERMRDEHLKDEHELQSYFVHRAEAMLLKHGKAMIGWDEILEGGLASTATVMSWTGEEGGITAANMGHDVIMTPLQYAYYDYNGQGAPEVEPVAIGHGISLEKAYHYEPVATKISPDKQHHILGAQANLWTEYSPTPEHTEYLLYPRLLAMAELAWTQKSRKDFTSFVRRLDNQYPRLVAYEVNYHIPMPEGPQSDYVALIDKTSLSFRNSRDLDMVYTLDGSAPTAKSALYTSPLSFTDDAVLKIATRLSSGKLGRTRTITVRKETMRPALADTEKLLSGAELLRASGKYYYVTDLLDAGWGNPEIVSDFNLNVAPESNGAFLYRGYFKVPADGIYYMTTEMDELKIDGELLISNSGKLIRHSVSRKSIALKKGVHSFELIYINSNIGGFHRYWNNRGFRFINEKGELLYPQLYHAKEDYFVKHLRFPANATLEQKVDMAARLVPTPEQLNWQRLELTAFLHFGINTFTGNEWGDGKEDPALFNPSELDAGQWVRTLKDVGFKMVILTAKHHDGFCLWPTKTTPHSVASSPWKQGKGDVVKELRQACDKYGMKFGVYLSPWDRNAACYGDSPKYNDFFVRQLTELLTNYGEIHEVWFDGANGEGPNGKKQVYDWDAYYKTIRRLQPKAVAAIMGDDVRWVGNEKGIGRETEWGATVRTPSIYSRASENNKLLNVSSTTADLGSRKMLAKARELFWYPSEVDVSIRPGWFYHKEQDAQVKTLQHLMEIYYQSVGYNSVLLLNIPPDKRGLINEADAARLKEFADYRKQVFASDKIKDGMNLWCAAPQDSRIYQLEQETSVNVIMLQEDIAKGQRVEKFTVEALTPEGWQIVGQGTTIGYKRLLRIPTVKANKIRVTIDECRLIANVSRIAAYYAAPLQDESPQVAQESMSKDAWHLLSSSPVTIDLGKQTVIAGFTYAPAGAEAKPTTAFRYKFQISNDGKIWTEVPTNGEFSNIINNPVPQTVQFKEKVSTRFIRLDATSLSGNPAQVSIEELSVR